MEALPPAREVDRDFVAEMTEELFEGDVLRAKNPSVMLVQFFWHEARTAGRDMALTSLELLKTLDSIVHPEKTRRKIEEDETAKVLVDGALQEAGFSFETLELRRKSDGAPYRKQILYRPGDAYPERCLVLSHGLTAGYESFYSVLGKQTMDEVAAGNLEAAHSFDSPLRKFSIILENRSGVDPDGSQSFIDNYNPRAHLLEQAAGQRATVEYARQMGARHIRIGGHSNGGLVTMENLRRPLPAEVRGAVLINSPGNARDSLAWEFPGMPLLLDSLAAAARSSNTPEGSWTPAALKILPEGLRDVMPGVTPEQVTRTVVTRTIGWLLGNVDMDSDICRASRHRFRHTDWRIFILDLCAMRHAKPLVGTDHLMDMHFLVLDGEYDRLVKMGTGQRLVREIDPFHGTTMRRADYKTLATGHFPQAQAPDDMNRILAKFMAGQRQ